MQPISQVLCSATATTATFTASASTVVLFPTAYQWYKNGFPISSAVSSTYTATGLTLADTVNKYFLVAYNLLGPTYSDTVNVKYIINTQPSGLYLATGSTATFSVGSSGVTAFKWQKETTDITGATNSVFSKPSIALADSGNYRAVLTHPGGTCITNTVKLIVENLPMFTLQPQNQILCNTSANAALFTATASSVSALSYQWYKNGSPVAGATASNFTATGLTQADTNSVYTVRTTNGVGFTNSSPAGFKYLILSQPAVSNYLPTGNPVTFSTSASSSATAFQWRKNGADVTGANSLLYKIDTATLASAGKYTLKVSYAGGFCSTDTSVLTVTTKLYSKASGNISDISIWGVMPDGSGNTPLTFGRSEHTFVMANRSTGYNGTNMTIAGTLDLNNATAYIDSATTLEAGRIIRSGTTGQLSVTRASSLIVHGKSDLYFDAAKKLLKNLTIITTDTVTLRSALDIAGGKKHGVVRVTGGVFNTGDSLTLKSDSLGTAGVGNSPGTITGKITVEQYIPAHRAWRLFTSPVSDSLAPTIHDAWQEGAISSTDNPHPGYGAHITNGAVSDGFDQNPQKTFSMKVRNASGQWIGVPATNTTKVTDYPAYFFFIRGNRAYDIEHTNETMASRSTTIRTTGYLRQHTQQNVAVNSNGFTLVANPYASPVDFENVFHHSSVAQHFYMWNPSLAGNKGVGAYVLVYWNGSGYSTAPALSGADSMRFLQAYQGFFVESNGSNSLIGFNENDKDTASLITPFGREVAANTPRLEINLNLYNSDSTISVADGATYLFSNSFNDSVDRDDIAKMGNVSENAGILSNGKLLALEQRLLPVDKDSLQLSLTNTRSASYQLDIIPNKMNDFNLYLYDRYTGNKTLLSAEDTNHVKIDINTSVEASKAADRFVIISKTVTLPTVMFTHLNAALKENAIEVRWGVINESNVSYYKLQRSADGITFSDIATITASGKEDYIYLDAKPLSGMNYYRVQSINRTGTTSYTGTVSEAFIRTTESRVTVSPNPLVTNRCTIELHNKPAGKYNVTLTSNSGVIVYATSVIITEANKKQALVLPASLAKGTYHLAIENGTDKDVIKLVSLY